MKKADTLAVRRSLDELFTDYEKIRSVTNGTDVNIHDIQEALNWIGYFMFDLSNLSDEIYDVIDQLEAYQEGGVPQLAEE